MPDLGITVSLKNTVDMQKIQELLKKAEVNILVGFPSGRVHVEAQHDEAKDKNGRTIYDANGEPKRKGGSKVGTKEGGVEQETWELAEELHFGSSRVPARPFLVDGLESKEKELREAIEAELHKAASGQSPNWKKVGTMAVGAINEFVRGDYYKTHIPNSKEWQKTKGSDTPLIDGGD